MANDKQALSTVFVPSDSTTQRRTGEGGRAVKEGRKVRVTDAYRRRLNNYGLWAQADWAPPGAYINAKHRQDEEVEPDIAMFLLETHSIEAKCSRPDVLAELCFGKTVRDFYAAQWKEDVKNGLFDAEEFFGNLGMDAFDFPGVFGHQPRESVLARVFRNNVREIAFLETLAITKTESPDQPLPARQRMDV